MGRNRLLLFLLLLYFFIEYLPFCPPVVAGTLYFKNGKSVLVDYAWIDKETIYAVHKGKRFAIGYNRDEIDITKSDINPVLPRAQNRFETPASNKYNAPPQPVKQEPRMIRVYPASPP